MLKHLFAAAVFAAAIFPAYAQAQNADALAPARAGQLQCYAPNTAHKTCQSLAGYAFAADGTINNSADTLILQQPAIVMRTNVPVIVRSGAVCGPIRAEDLQGATFTIDGAPATAQQTETMRAQLAQQMAGILNVDICTTYVADGDGFRAEASFNGAPRPDLNQHVIWVGANDGWTVAP